MMRIGGIILARLDSRRLPGKALRALCGKPLVGWAVDVCRAVRGLDAVVLATSSRPEDDALAAFMRARDVPVFRGDCDDVAGRFLAAMEAFELDGALRFNGDSPLHRPALLEDAVRQFREADCDLVSNVPGRSYPYGISAEVVSRRAMQAAVDAMSSAAEREHVTQIFYQKPERFRMRLLTAAEAGMSGVQLAVDDENDLARASWVLSHLEYPLHEAPLRELVRLARAFDACTE